MVYIIVQAALLAAGAHAAVVLVVVGFRPSFGCQFECIGLDKSGVSLGEARRYSGTGVDGR